MGKITDLVPPMDDLRRYESINETLEAILASTVSQGDTEAAEKLRAHIAWNRTQIERLRTPAASA